MNEITNWTELFLQSLTGFGEKIMSGLSSIIGAIFIILLGLLLAKVVSLAVKKVLHVAKFDQLAEKVNVQDFLDKANISLTPSALIAKFFNWIIILMVIITASETLGWTAVSDEISKLIGYLPQLLAAIVFFIVGTFIATFVRDVILSATRTLQISAGKLLATVVFYLLMIVISLTSLQQAGIDTSIITSNLLIIIGSLMLSVAISYGFASREVLSNILGSYFGSRTFSVGQKIKIDNNEGVITDITRISITIRLSENRDLVIPANQLISKQIEIIKE